MLLRMAADRRPGVESLLNYGQFVDDGIIELTDGAFLIGYHYAGPDLDSASRQERMATAGQVNATLAQLGNGWMLHADARRLPSVGYPPPAVFPDRTSALIDAERRRQYEAEGAHYETTYTLTFTYRPPTAIRRRFGEFFFSGGNDQRPSREVLLSLFQHAVQRIEDGLSSVLSLGRMSSAELLQHLHACITGLAHPIATPEDGAFLDGLLSSQDFWTGFTPRMGQLHTRVIALTGLPFRSRPQLLQFLNEQPIAFRWSNRFIVLDPQTAIRELQRYRRNWYQLRVPLKDLAIQAFTQEEAAFENTDAVSLSADADAALNEAREGRVRFGYYTSVIVVTDPIRATVDTVADELVKTLQHHGVGARVETVNSVPAWRGSLPGQGTPNVRKPLLHTLNLAHLLPLSSVWAGALINPCPYFPPKSPPLLHATTTGSTPFRLHLHVRDVGHSILAGPTGNGKTTLLAMLKVSFRRYSNAQIFCFDRDYGALVPTLACGGEFYDLAGEDNDVLAFAPLAQVHQESERHWAQEWLELLLRLQGVEVTPVGRKAMQQALERIAGLPPAMRTLTHFVSQLQDPVLKDGVRYYTLNGPAGALLDAEQDTLASGRWQTFEMSHLLQRGEKIFVPVLSYLFHHIDRRLDGAPTLIPIDEGWMAALHTIFRDQLETWLRTLRKKNGALVLVVHSVSDLAKFAHKDLLLESCKTKIFLPNVEALNDDVRPHYQGVGLTPRQIERIAAAVPKREYYIVSELGRRLINLELGPVALSIVGVNGRDERTHIQGLQQQYGAEWPVAWFEERSRAAAVEGRAQDARVLADAARQWQNGGSHER